MVDEDCAAEPISQRLPIEHPKAIARVCSDAALRRAGNPVLNFPREGAYVGGGRTNAPGKNGR